MLQYYHVVIYIYVSIGIYKSAIVIQNIQLGISNNFQQSVYVNVSRFQNHSLQPIRSFGHGIEYHKSTVVLLLLFLFAICKMEMTQFLLESGAQTLSKVI